MRSCSPARGQGKRRGRHRPGWEQVDLESAVVWIPESKTPHVAEVPLTDMAREAFREQIRISGPGSGCSPRSELLWADLADGTVSEIEKVV